MKYLNNINSPDDIKGLNSDELHALIDEIRAFLVQSISLTGGHLSSNLGVVELTVALHYCYNMPDDKIIWDVGHQSYVHKILTGRKERFDTLRKHKGLSGFPKGVESEYDSFDTGHSSTSISAAYGMACARDILGRTNKVVAVIGDGSMTGGMAYEALNNAGRSKTNLTVVLNDNEMSISKNVGAISRHLNDIRTAPSYLRAKKDVNDFLLKIPVVGKGLRRFIELAKNKIRYFLLPGVLFEELGFKYIGPIDGNNLDELIKTFTKIKKIEGPVLVHVNTKKGKGYFRAENAPSDFHGVDCFDIETGISATISDAKTYSDVFSQTIVEIAAQDERVVAVTAAMPLGIGLVQFSKAFPQRFFDVGIAEAHAATFAAGLAKEGLIPVFAVYSTFLQRSYDQILHDVCIQNLPVIFAIDRAGIVGSDGETHQGIFDLSYLNHIPNITIMAPKSGEELAEMLRFAVDIGGPVAIRYPRSVVSERFCSGNNPIELGKAEILERGSRIAVISVGAMADTAYEALEKLKAGGLTPTLVNARFVKPIDEEMAQSLSDYEYVFTIEDNVRSGGFGVSLLSLFAKKGYKAKVEIFAFPDEFIEQGTRGELFKQFGLDSESIYEKIAGKIYG